MYLVASGATQSLKIEVKDEVDFLHTDKHQSFLQVNFNTFGIAVSYKMITTRLYLATDNINEWLKVTVLYF